MASKWSRLTLHSNSTILCTVCKIILTSNDNFLQCGLCQKFVHLLDCSEVTPAEYERLNRTDSNLRWFCPSCNSHVDEVLKFLYGKKDVILGAKKRRYLEAELSDVSEKSHDDATTSNKESEHALKCTHQSNAGSGDHDRSEKLETCVQCSQNNVVTSEKACQTSDALRIVDLPQQILAKILSYYPHPYRLYYNSEGEIKRGEDYQFLLPLRILNRYFAHVIPRIVLQKVTFTPRSLDKLNAFFKSLTKPLLCCGDEVPFNYVEELNLRGCFETGSLDVYSLLKGNLAQFKGLFSHATRLEFFDCYFGPSWDSVGIRSVSFFNSPSLSRMVICGPFPSSFFSFMNNPGVLPNLRQLEITNQGASSTDYIQGLADGVGRLDRLEIHHDNISCKQFVTILFPSLQNLKMLDLYSIEEIQPPEFYTAIAEHCTKLEKLRLSELGDTELELLSRDFNNGESCFRKSISVIQIGATDDITVKCIPSLKRFPNLKRFGISDSLEYWENEYPVFEREVPGLVIIGY